MAGFHVIGLHHLSFPCRYFDYSLTLFMPYVTNFQGLDVGTRHAVHVIVRRIATGLKSRCLS
mgnify:CR=1 FL=1